MSRRKGLHNGRYIYLLSAILVAACVVMAPAQVQARRDAGWSSAKYAAIVIDANTDRVLYAKNADSSRYPASLTKMMTLYLLYEQMANGRVSKSTSMRVSGYAAAQAPSKLGLMAGQSIEAEKAILVLVTKSANDVATVVAEHISGSESAFAAAMTRKARALGMSNTTFRNASGLPDPRQRTTARDMSILARALLRDYPQYYHYFNTRSFAYNGRYYRNHNRLLGRVDGVDGIKTGYTNASGFNLTASAQRGTRHLVAVVMGGPTARARDTHMRKLLNDHFARASTQKTIRARAPQVLIGEAPLPEIRPERGAGPLVGAVANAPLPVLKPHLITPAADTVADAARGETPAAGVAERHDPIQSILVKQDMQTQDAGMVTVLPANPATPQQIAPDAGVTQSIAQLLREQWLIQIGAYNEEQAAREKLREAQEEAEVLKARLAYTEPVHKDDLTLYRARFAGFDRDGAKQACKELKKANFKCLPMRQ